MSQPAWMTAASRLLTFTIVSLIAVLLWAVITVVIALTWRLVF